MPKIDVLNIKGEKVNSIELNADVFDVEVNTNVMHDVVVNHLANKRQGTHSAKTRAEVRGGGRKPFRQKGTGRARQGSIRAPHYVGGGIAFAKKPRDYSYKLPKKVKQLALKSALSSKVQEGKLIVLDNLEMNNFKTKEFKNIITAIGAGVKPMFVTLEKNETAYYSSRNIPGVNMSFVGELNIYDIINSRVLVLTEPVVKRLEEVYS